MRLRRRLNTQVVRVIVHTFIGEKLQRNAKSFTIYDATQEEVFKIVRNAIEAKADTKEKPAVKGVASE